MNLLLRIAMTHVRGRLRQTVVSILGVMLGVGFSIAMASLMEGSQRDFVSQLIDAIPHVQVTDEERNPPRQPAQELYDAVAFSGLRVDDDRRGIRNPVAVRAGLESWVDGVFSPALSGQAVVRYGGKDVAVTLTGIQPRAEMAVSKIADDVVQGSFFNLESTASGIVVGDGMTRKLGAEFGDTVTVTSAGGLVKRYKIVGLFHSSLAQTNDTIGYVPLKAAQILFERPNVINRLNIRLSNVNDAEAIAARIERQIGYKAVSWQEANKSLQEAFVIRNLIMYTVVGAILLVAGFGIFNIVATIVHEKARDIAILKSLGFYETDMQYMFVFEGLMIGAAGSLFGWALGYVLCLALSTVQFQIPGTTDSTFLPIYFTITHYLIASGFALASAGIAGYLPARRAARLNPVDIIRGAT
ncbi:ABC transporter permease [Breoghania sp. L-A4]|uniref:ABC transporter permease n=1 Tax=Breoghania sp. L-A4 TaxID=2304600 RepID=UPI000E359517|nr:ABC transporter permease [Breoghania sp. L-A4]AXS39436.1 ABC transporter permease [Breoghania sp. L-A4]